MYNKLKLNKKLSVLLLTLVGTATASPLEDPERKLLDRELEKSNTQKELLIKHNKKYKNIDEKKYIIIEDESKKEPIKNKKKPIKERITPEDKIYINSIK